MTKPKPKPASPAAAPPAEPPTTETSEQIIARLKETIEKQNDELAAFRKRVSTEKDIVSEIKVCESRVESAKSQLSAAKEQLGHAHERLSAFVGGDVQTELPFGDEGHRTAYEQGYAAYDPKLAGAINPYQNDPQKSEWQRGYEAGEKAKNLPAWAQQKLMVVRWDPNDGSIKLPNRELSDGAKAEIRRGKLLTVSDNTVREFERDYLVLEHEFDASLALCLPLYDKDEWSQLYEDKFGRAVEGVDQSDEAKLHRQTGGEFCGLVVKHGRKKAVIGPMKDGVVIDYNIPDEATEMAERAATTGKDAAAGKEPETLELGGDDQPPVDPNDQD